MCEQTKRGRAQDRAKVAGGQDHEVRHEAEKTGSSHDQVGNAVKIVGNSRGKVEQHSAGSDPEEAPTEPRELASGEHSS